MAEYTEAFARYILECRDAYSELCDRINKGEVEVGMNAKLVIHIPSEVVDEIRTDLMVARN